MTTPAIHEKEQSEPDWMKEIMRRSNPDSIGCNQVDYKIPHPYGRVPVYPPWHLELDIRPPCYYDYPSYAEQRQKEFNLALRRRPPSNPKIELFAPPYYKIEFAEKFPTPTEEGLAKGWYDTTPWDKGFCNHAKDIPSSTDGALSPAQEKEDRVMMERIAAWSDNTNAPLSSSEPL